MTDKDAVEGRFSTDRETIEQWAETHHVTPVRVTGTKGADDAGTTYRLDPAAEGERDDTAETLGWDEFMSGLDDDGFVVVNYGESRTTPLEVIKRDQAITRTTMEGTDFEERLMEGETVTSEVTETTVIERTVVEHATIESEVVDTEVLDSRVVEADLKSRKIGGCDVVGRDKLDDIDRSRFEDMDRLEAGGQEDLPQPVAVEVDVEENWSVTRELLERATIESRVTDTDVTETDRVESESVESSIEIEGVQRSLLESDVIDTEADSDEIIGSEMIESEFHEDDVVRTRLNQRRKVRDDITERRLLRGELTESEILEAETTGTTLIETSFVDSDRLDSDAKPFGVTEYGSDTLDAESESTETRSAAMAADRDEGAEAEIEDMMDGDSEGMEAGSTSDRDTKTTGSSSGSTADRDAKTTASGSKSTTDRGDEGVQAGDGSNADTRTSVTEEDAGKPVVDAEGQEVGIVEEVVGTTAYVDPEPGILSRIRSKMGWGEHDEEDYALDESTVERITDDEVQLKRLK